MSMARFPHAEHSTPACPDVSSCARSVFSTD
jgi:hypothetical protein